MPTATLGMRSETVAKVMTLRVPKIGTRNEYGIRRVAPTSPGSATSQKRRPVPSEKPSPGRRTTMALHMNHVENDRVSAIVVIHSVLLATRAPDRSQNA